MKNRPSIVTGTNDTTCSTMAAAPAASAGAPEKLRHRQPGTCSGNRRRPRRRRRHADGQVPDHEERADEGNRQIERPGRQPDAQGNREPERHRPAAGDRQMPRTAHDLQALGERLDEVTDERGGPLRQATRQPTGPAAEPLGMAGEHEQHRRARRRTRPRPRARRLRPRARRRRRRDSRARAKSRSTVQRSSRRSTMTVANAAAGFSPPAAPAGTDAAPRRRAPAERRSAAKPITVVRNAVRKRAPPIGPSSDCQRQARST